MTASAREYAMVFIRLLVSAAAAAIVIATSATARADEGASRVASIAAKGTIPPALPLEAGLCFCVASGAVALGLARRSRR
jgi:hypothetical protein